MLGFAIPILHLFNWSRIEFPLCRRCKKRFFIQRWGRTLFLWAAMIVALIFLAPRFNQFAPSIRRYLIVGSALLALIPYMAFEVFVPRAFSVFAGQGRTSYDFASRTVAMQFYLANSQRYPNAKIRIDMDWKLPRT
jgi:hypothetical protein